MCISANNLTDSWIMQSWTCYLHYFLFSRCIHDKVLYMMCVFLSKIDLADNKWILVFLRTTSYLEKFKIYRLSMKIYQTRRYLEYRIRHAFWLIKLFVANFLQEMSWLLEKTFPQLHLLFLSITVLLSMQ